MARYGSKQNDDYEYEYAYQPKVLIYNTSGGYKMKVEGMDDTIYVKRLK